MVELLKLHKKLKMINVKRQPAHALYLYGNLAYYTIHAIMRLSKNYSNCLCTLTQDKFNKVMMRLRIEIEHGFAIHQNFWTWNDFHLQLKVQQSAVVGYAVLVLLANIWTYL